MSRYSGNGNGAVGTDKTLINLFNVATASQRARIYEFIVGCAATPGDQASQFVLQRTTAVGTEGSGLVPAPLDPADGVSTYDFGLGVFGAEPTYTAAKVMVAFALHQRNTFRWVAMPGSEIVLPITDSNGAGIKSTTGTGTASHNACILFEE